MVNGKLTPRVEVLKCTSRYWAGFKPLRFLVGSMVKKNLKDCKIIKQEIINKVNQDAQKFNTKIN